MKNEHKKAVVEGLEKELHLQEDMLRAADEELKRAQAKFDVAGRKYAAIRDALTKYLGYSPYEKVHGEIEEPVFDDRDNMIGFDKYGEYRFIYMSIGNAVIAALKEAEKPLTLEGIVQKLLDGGIRKSESTLPRAVNAALMRTKGVQKTKKGEYFYPGEIEEEEVEPEDLPF